MTPRQRLMRVELPLALPEIVAGIRVAAVIGVGTATIAAAVGAGAGARPRALYDAVKRLHDERLRQKS